MSLSVTATVVATCFIAGHGGPANYFATFSEKLKEKGHSVDIYALGKAANTTFISRKTPVKEFFDADALSSKELEKVAEKIARCYHRVIIDVANRKNIEFIGKLKQQNPEILITAFCDNPNAYVPGGYSTVAAKVLLMADKALFVNANHEKDAIYEEFDKEIPLPFEKRIGLGCYPVKKAEELSKQREQKQAAIRAQVFAKYGLEDKDQKVLVYFGGNNDEYFESAFPAFLGFLSEGIKQTDLSNTVIMLQQHPRAKDKEGKDSDHQQLNSWMEKHGTNPFAPKIILSEETSNDMQVLADGVLYHQTSMGPVLALAGIDMIQIGDKKPYKDGMVDSRICPSVTSSSGLVEAMQTIESKPLSEEKKEAIYKSLGKREDWFARLQQELD